jgi:hypothetical protein
MQYSLNTLSILHVLRDHEIKFGIVNRLEQLESRVAALEEQ